MIATESPPAETFAATIERLEAESRPSLRGHPDMDEAQFIDCLARRIVADEEAKSGDVASIDRALARIGIHEANRTVPRLAAVAVELGRLRLRSYSASLFGLVSLATGWLAIWVATPGGL